MRLRLQVTLVVAYSLVVGTACSGAPESTTETTAASPQAAVDELLATDRAFAAASATTDLVTALTAMFADDIVQPLPGGEWARGEARVVEALLSHPDNSVARLEWTPVRGGISADGQQGFTFGYMTMTKADSSTVPLKYLAYWVKDADGWHVVAYRRRPRPAGEVPLALMSSALPTDMMAPVTDSTVLSAHATSLAAAEQSFSDEAQVIGIGTAFAKYGSADAMNMGGPDDTTFVIGSEQIGRNIGGTPPATGSTVTWNADRVIVASSGDLGVTFGIIREKTDSTGRYPFFTIWRRASPRDPWRYIAE